MSRANDPSPDGMWAIYGFVSASAVRVRFAPRGARPVTVATLPR